MCVNSAMNGAANCHLFCTKYSSRSAARPKALRPECTMARAHRGQRTASPWFYLRLQHGASQQQHAEYDENRTSRFQPRCIARAVLLDRNTNQPISQYQKANETHRMQFSEADALGGKRAADSPAARWYYCTKYSNG